MKKIIFLILIGAAFLFVSFEAYQLYAERRVLREEAAEVQEQVSQLEGEQAKLKSEVGYFSDIRNLAKELKSLFNYKQQGEHLIIIVPKEEP